MKTVWTAMLLSLIVAAPLAADAGEKDAPQERNVRRTVIVRDGKVIEDTGDIVLEKTLLGGGGYIGVSLVEMTDELREHFGAAKDQGVLVGSVAANSPADKAGVKVGDIILSIDGKEVASQIDVRRAISGKKEGDGARIEVLRGRTRQTLVASVAERQRPRLIEGERLEEITTRLNSPEWRARILSAENCGELQTKIKDLETRLKELEKKLQK